MRPEDVPTEAEWQSMCDEMIAAVAKLRGGGRGARLRAREVAVIDGYPNKSLPESSIASGRHADPTATTVLRLAGGRDDEIVCEMDEFMEGQRLMVGCKGHNWSTSVDRSKATPKDVFEKHLAQVEASKQDSWEAVPDEIGMAVENMHRLTRQARDSLRGATSALNIALPPNLKTASSREVCKHCETPKDVVGVKNWVQAEGACSSCVRRKVRYAKEAVG